MEQATTAGVQDSRKAEESRSDHLGEGKCTDKNAPKGLGWRQTGVYSQAPERQKANSGLYCSGQGEQNGIHGRPHRGRHPQALIVHPK